MSPRREKDQQNCRPCSPKVHNSRTGRTQGGGGGGINWKWSSPYKKPQKSEERNVVKKDTEDVRMLLCSLKRDVRTICEHEKKVPRCPVAGVPSFEPLYLLSDMMCKLSRLERSCLGSPCEQEHRLRKKRYMLALLRCCCKLIARNVSMECEMFKARQCTMSCVLKSLARLERHMACPPSSPPCPKASNSRANARYNSRISSRGSPRLSHQGSPRISLQGSPRISLQGSPRSSSLHVNLQPQSPSYPKLNTEESKHKDEHSVYEAAPLVNNEFTPDANVTDPCADTTRVPIELDSLKLTYLRKNVRVELPGGSDYVGVSDCSDNDNCLSAGQDPVVYKKNHPGGGFTESTYRNDPEKGNVYFTVSYKPDPGCAGLGTDGDSCETPSETEDLEESLKKMSRLWYMSAQHLCNSLADKVAKAKNQPANMQNFDC